MSRGYQISQHSLYLLGKNSWRLQTNTETQTTFGIPPACMIINPCFLVISEWVGKESISKLQETFLTGPIQASVLSVRSTRKALLKMRANVVSFHWRDRCGTGHSTTDSISLDLSALGLTAYVERSHVWCCGPGWKEKALLLLENRGALEVRPPWVH